MRLGHERGSARRGGRHLALHRPERVRQVLDRRSGPGPSMARRSGAAGSGSRAPGRWTASASARRRACPLGRGGSARGPGTARGRAGGARAQSAIVSEPGDPQVLVHRERAEDPLTLRHVADPEPRDGVRGQAVRSDAPSKRTAPRRGWSRPMTVRRVVVLPAPFRPRSTVTASGLHAEGDALEDVVLADVGVDVLELEEWRHARARPAPEVGGLDLGVPARWPTGCRRR